MAKLQKELLKSLRKEVFMSNIKSISMIGLGYIGLPTAAIFASHGIKVIGVDTNIDTVNIINQGRIHIAEPDLDILVHEVVKERMLFATPEPEPADAFLIAVPTPFKERHKPDLSYVKAAANSISKVLKKGDLVILESTSPVGTTENMAEWLAEMRPDLIFPQQKDKVADVNIAYCPERVLPGKIIQELISNDRIIGGMTSHCSHRATKLYQTFVKGKCISTNVRTAEMCKLTENTFRDVNIAFANELSFICDKLDIDVWELITLANRHPRVNILQPGPGVGGHCIAVDPWFIVDKTPVESKLIHIARKVNDAKPDWVVNKVLKLAKKLKNPNIACFGLSFKADIDDLRESPALEIVKKLHSLKIGKLYLVEPNIVFLPNTLEHLERIKLVTIETALQQSKIVLLLVDHKEFKGIPKNNLKNKNIIDTKGIWKDIVLNND